MNQRSHRFAFQYSIDAITRFGGALAAIALLSLALLIGYEVVLRYLFGQSTTWVQEVSVYLCIAIGFLGAAYALMQNQHFAITFFIDKLGRVGQRRLRIVTHCMGLFYSLTFVIKGIEMVQFSHMMNDISTGLLKVPLWIPGCLVPVGGGLLLLQFFSKIIDETASKLWDEGHA